MNHVLSYRRANTDDVLRIVQLGIEGKVDNKSEINLPLWLPQSYYDAFERIAKDPYQQLIVAEHQKIIIATFQLSFITYLAGQGHEDCQIEAFYTQTEQVCLNSSIIGLYMTLFM